MQRHRFQPRPHQHLRQRIDVVAGRTTSHQRRLQRRRSAAREGIVDRVARPGQTIDEEFRKLRLEAGAVADLMQVVALALAGGPVLVDEIRMPASSVSCVAAPLKVNWRSNREASRRPCSWRVDRHHTDTVERRAVDQLRADHGINQHILFLIDRPVNLKALEEQRGLTQTRSLPASASPAGS